MPLTKQQIFDRVLTHLRQQGQAAMAPHGCAYRASAEDGRTLMCAVGCLIPDSLYDESIEGKNVIDDGAVTRVLVKASVVEADDRAAYSLLVDLQYAHDAILGTVTHRNPMTEWEKRMVFIAQRHGLAYSPPVVA